MKKLYTLLTLFTIGLLLSFESSAQVNISNSTDTTCTNTLFDSGGSGSDYSASEDITFVISPTGVSSITINIDSIGLAAGDSLRIFDGADTNATLLFTALDTTSYIPPSIISSGGSLTVHFFSDATTEDYGWSMQWTSTLTTSPSVSISVSDNSVCTGDQVSFAVTDSTGGGFDPVFEWFRNSTTVGGDSNVYNTTGLANDDTVWVEMTQASCPQDIYKVISSKEVITVNNIVTGSVTVAADTVVCSDDSVVFTATPVNGGGSPTYVWTVNGVGVGTNSPTYGGFMTDGDSVRVEMGSSISTGCIIDSVSADWVTMDVTTSPVASVSLAASDTNICDGTVVTFTATPTNGGTTPVYSWFVNGGAVGIDSTGYLDSTLSNGDVVTVTMASDIAGGCLIDSISSDSTTMVVTGNVTASVSLAVDDPSVCAGVTQNFTATPTNGGASPTYSWRINGAPIANTGATYASSTLSDGDNVAVTMASDLGGGCLLDSISADSLDVNINPVPTASISGSTNLLCAGVLTGTATGSAIGGTGSYSYLWDDPSTQMTAMATGLDSLSYSVIITDDSSCSDTAFVTLSSPLPLDISFSVTNVSGFGQSDGAVTATASGGVFIDNPGPTNDGYNHMWSNNVNSSNPRFVHTISSLSAGAYTDTITDDNGCVYFETAFVVQPDLLNPGLISVGGITSKTVCYDSVPGMLDNDSVASGGKGTLDYLWQSSTDLLNWVNLTASNSTSYNYTDTLSEITFVRRAVADSTGDSAYSNILFLNYIAPTVLNVNGLNSSYCTGEAPVLIFGSPSAPGTGWFTPSAFLDSTGNLDPALGDTSMLNTITYNYTDAYGCANDQDFFTTVYWTDTGSVWLDSNQIVFSPNEGPVKLNSTYPGGTFSGPGVSQVGADYFFTASSIPGNVDISFTYTNANGCVSYDTVKAIVQISTISMYSSKTDTSIWGGCYHNGLEYIYAVIPSGSTVHRFRWYSYYYNGTTTLFNVPGNLAFTDTSVNGDTIFWAYDPTNFLPAGASGYYDSVQPTPAGATQLTIVFQYYLTTDSFSIRSLFEPNFDLVNLTNVKINPNIGNSNGTSGNPLQYCESLTSVNFGSSTFPITGRSFDNEFDPLPGLTDNGDGTASFDPSAMGPEDTVLTFTYTDIVTGCAVDTTYQLTIDSLPELSINTIPDSGCANDPVINFTGSPYTASKGFFTSPTGGILNLNQTGANASIAPGPANDNLTHGISYFYTDANGCSDTITDSIKINPIPTLAIRRTGFTLPTDSLVHCLNEVSDYDRLINGILDTNTMATLVGTGFIDSLDNEYTANTVGDHTVTYSSTAANGCSNSADTIITVRALADASFTLSASTVCDSPGDSVTMTATFGGGLNQKWYFYGDSATGSVAKFDISSGMPGMYNVVEFVTDDGSIWGCTNSNEDSIFINSLPGPSFTHINPDNCVNQGSDSLVVDLASVGSSYFRSYHFVTGSKVYNNLVDSNALAGGVNAITYVPFDVIPGNSTDVIYVEYVHEDGNACENNLVDSIYIRELPTLTITTPDDGKLCALNDSISLQGLANGIVPGLPGNFYGSVFGSSYTSTTNASLHQGQYGPVAVDSFLSDSVYYEYTDNFGCYNDTFRVFTVRQLPPADFVFLPSGNPQGDHFCPDGIATATAAFDPSNCPTCAADWSSITRSWQIVLDTANITLTTPRVLNPANDPHVVGGWNVIRHTITDLSLSPNCVSVYEDSVYIDEYPTPYAWVDSNELSGAGYVVCSNEGDMTIKFSPPSADIGIESRIYSNGMYGGFSSDIPVGQDSIVLGRDSLNKNTSGTFKNTYTFFYEFTDSTTHCTATQSAIFDLKTAPVLSSQLPSTKVYCPTDLPSSLQLFVFNDPLLIGAGANTFGGLGIDSVVTSTNELLFYPDSFPEYLKSEPVWTWKHEDVDNCVDSTTIAGITINNLPELRFIIPFDSVCQDASNFILYPQYRDTATGSFANYTAFTGDNNDPNDIFIEFGRNESGGQIIFSPSVTGGATSNRYYPETDSKFGQDAIMTLVQFTGSYPDGNGIGKSGCQASIIDSIATRAKPIADFYLAGQCSKYAPVLRGDSSTMDTIFDMNDFIDEYVWTVDGITATDPGTDQVLYTHDTTLTVGLHNFDLTVISKEGCSSDEVSKSYTFVESPDADFDWNMDGECKGNQVTFRDRSSIPAGANIEYNWYFGDGALDTAIADTILTTTHSYANAQAYNVLLEVNDKGNCLDSIEKTIFIRDWIETGDYPYIDSFQEAYSGWAVWRQQSDQSISHNPSWFTWGHKPEWEYNVSSTDTAGNPIIIDSVRNNIFFGDSADRGWYLDYHFEKILSSSGFVDSVVFRYDDDMQTSVIGPCFDLTSTERPMIVMNSIHNTEGSDGVVVQYTTDVGKPLSEVVWKNVGEFRTDAQNNHIETGIRWYNKQNIFGNPGSQTDLQGKIGFTDLSNPDSVNARNIVPTWYESRNDINDAKDESYVRFRVAFGSNADAKGEGYIFDDFAIRERKKNIVYETFVNLTKNDTAALAKHSKIVENSLDVLDIQYHTAFPKADPINQDNTADPGARALYYGISDVAFLQGEGNQFSEKVASKNYGSFTLKARALEDPKFDVAMKYNTSTKKITTIIACNGEEFLGVPVDVTVQIALLEKSIPMPDGVNPSFASSNYAYPLQNTLKKLIPNASGTNFNNMIKGSVDSVSYTVPEVEYYGNFDDEMKIVAFVQNRKTKEIYQANWVDFNNNTTGGEEYESIVDDGVEYNLYPNPTQGFTTMDFNKQLNSNYQLTIYNQLGAVVHQEIVPAGTQRHSFDIDGLKAGMYFVMLNDGTHEVAIKKLMLTQ